MKKSLYLLVAIFASAIFLVACSKGENSSPQSSLDGEYYATSNYSDDGLTKSPWVVIDGKTFTYYAGGKDDPDGTLRYSIDTEKQTLTGENEVKSYAYDNGLLQTGIAGGEAQFVKKDSKKYNELKNK